MLIKIPLILRELRCQNIYENISGGYCCVPDMRVIEAADALDLNLSPVTERNLFQLSERIYGDFGDLYDLPLFAYEDIRQHMH